ncbi:MAG: hypothetical protein SWX82_27590 [Cyanobacteriota bacterium]|nr:hypothetical protein [Cyanobacteriota bacterium]
MTNHENFSFYPLKRGGFKPQFFGNLVSNAKNKLIDKIWNNLGESYFADEKPFLKFNPMDIGYVE